MGFPRDWRRLCHLIRKPGCFKGFQPALNMLRVPFWAPAELLRVSKVTPPPVEEVILAVADKGTVASDRNLALWAEELVQPSGRHAARRRFVVVGYCRTATGRSFRGRSGSWSFPSQEVLLPALSPGLRRRGLTSAVHALCEADRFAPPRRPIRNRGLAYAVILPTHPQIPPSTLTL